MHSDLSFVSAELCELPYEYGFLLEEETPQWRELSVQCLSLKYKYWFKRVFSSYTSRYGDSCLAAVHATCGSIHIHCGEKSPISYMNAVLYTTAIT